MNQSFLNRRDFLGLTLVGVSASATFPLFLGKTAAAVSGKADPDDDRILVVIQLSGGNDGLSTVVPYPDPAYGRARITTRIRESDVLRLDERVGFHPNLKELKEIYDDGKMAVVQGTSYPNPTRSHFESMDIWHTADRGGARRGSGWLGRAIDSTCNNRRTPLFSVSLGNKVPLALTGEINKPVALKNAGSYQWRGRPGQLEAFKALNARGKDRKKTGRIQQLDFLRQVATDAADSSKVVRQALQGYRPSVEYPARNNRLASDLRSVGAMIAAGLPTRVYYVSIGGFDTHANQRVRHDNLMTTYSSAVSAFLKDLEARKLLDRVLLLTFSEFGRRVKENGSAGTDHGVAAPMFLYGNRVRGGLHGKHPSLTELVKGDLAMTVDFRQVYASVLDDWLGVPSKEILGESYQKLPLLSTARKRARL